ncbi:protein expanded [Teleopsis dalmanni]|uniref:protein expanded n=1 Tax=Teleopsis dalmanni TaxID=139649 RepID=UPI0018CCD218|nr:protein expanded [Teleopsis dalmanni]XP_037957422.1 protein expanded [Teleopsis dalmanni]XP_037957423.1 protein expanded [Teleopsis dalmanni]
MRAFCTVSAPLEACASSIEQLSPGSRFLALKLLGNQQPKTLYYLVNAKSRVREVYTQTCLHFAAQGMQDTELFGLAVLIDGEYLFTDPECKLSKYGPKSWRSSHTHGLDANGRPLLELYFRVQFYIEKPPMLKDETSKHYYYLQLRHNVLQDSIVEQYSQESIILLAGLALQADLGDAPIAKEVDSDTNNKCFEKEMVSKTDDKEQTIDSIVCQQEEYAEGSDLSDTNVSPKKSVADPSVINMKISSAKTTLSKTAIRRENCFTQIKALTHSPSISSIAHSLDQTCIIPSKKNIPVIKNYFCLKDYLPVDFHTAFAVEAVHNCHREYRGMTTSDAKLQFIQQACNLNEFVNAHTYRMRRSKSENGPGDSWIGVYAKGIKIICGDDNSQKQVTFLWPSISKLSFERKKFEIRSEGKKITLYATSDEKNKMLLMLCKETHQFNMKFSARLKEVIKRQEEQQKSQNVCFSQSHKVNSSYNNDQRISVISNTSSNTTSGVVSDRVHSEDELEILINKPVTFTAASTESLALEHLIEKSNISRQPTPERQEVCFEKDLDTLSIDKIQNQYLNSSKTKDTTSLHRKGNSQGSSSCKTLVVPLSPETLPLNAQESLSTRTIICHNSLQRSNSTSSSLQLSFSHTAQNSIVSESELTHIKLDYNLPNAKETESVVDIYSIANGAPPTETSGVYTMASSELTEQSFDICESVKYCTYEALEADKNKFIGSEHKFDSGNEEALQNKIDKDVFRLRSDSCASVSESFRGDGSDPNDKHTLLSAEELTDLIVGRSNHHCSKNESTKLSSSCDYVTLPLIMRGESYIKGHEDTAPMEDLDDILSNLSKEESQSVEKTVLKDPNIPLRNHNRTSAPYMTCQEKIKYRSSIQGSKLSNSKASILSYPKSYVPFETAVTTNITNPTEFMVVPPKTTNSLKNPPPYTKEKHTIPDIYAKPNSFSTHSLGNIRNESKWAHKPEEATARFITSRPQINVLKAHTSLVKENTSPSFAAPTNSLTMSASTSYNHIPQCNLVTDSQSSVNLSQNLSYVKVTPMKQRTISSGHIVVPKTISIPLMPYGLENKGIYAIQQSSLSNIAYADKQPTHTCLYMPVIEPGQLFPPPPSTIPRQPPPPPPPPPRLSKTQLELYQQSYNRDPDYRIYASKDAAFSHKDYVDANYNSFPHTVPPMSVPPHPSYLHFHMNRKQPSERGSYRGHKNYCSTEYLPMSISSHSRFASTQNLSDTYVQLPNTYLPLYPTSMTSLYSSCEPPPPISPSNVKLNTSTMFSRSRSDDNILGSINPFQGRRRMPPPPPPLPPPQILSPPPYIDRRLKKLRAPQCDAMPPPIPRKPKNDLSFLKTTNQTSALPFSSSNKHNSIGLSQKVIVGQCAVELQNANMQKNRMSSITVSCDALNISENYPHNTSTKSNHDTGINRNSNSSDASASTSNIDIALIREQSRYLDLPLISALCNDRTLFSQTNAADTKLTRCNESACHTNQKVGDTIKNNGQNSNLTSGATLLAITPHKKSISHRYPNDRLPPLPTQSAEANICTSNSALLNRH